jgi:hypothetical protein
MYASIGIDEFPLADVRVMCKSLDRLWNFGWYIAHRPHSQLHSEKLQWEP